MNHQPETTLGVIGGSGLYSLFTDGVAQRPPTPYGEASDAVSVGELADRPVAFLPRHGTRHELLPHRVNYRANLWTLHSIGVRRIIGVGAVGSLTADAPPGSIVVPDQLVDRTTGRESTFFEGPHVAHAPFADPYCGPGRKAAVAVSTAVGHPAVDGGTQVVIQGPRFSTRAESLWYAAQGWSLVGMTAMPEVALARELGICYIPLCLVTDLDAGLEVGAGVTQEEVMSMFTANLTKVRRIVAELAATLSADPCECADLAPQPL